MADTRDTSDVLLQVVLPIVLILTYCVLQSARNCLALADEFQGKYRQALIELQKQRILAALETIESRRRQELGLALLSRKEILLSKSGQLLGDHAAFQATCRETFRIFLTEGSLTEEKARDYGLVLQLAKLRDATPWDADAAPQEASLAMQAASAERNEITPGNRKFLKTRIEGLLASQHQEIVELELRVLQTALETYRNLPLDELYHRIPELKALKESLVQALYLEQKTSPEVDSLLPALFRRIREDFKEQGYDFLPEIWETS